MKSPINNESDVVLEKEIAVDRIVNLYKKKYLIDVRKYFLNLEKVGLFKCIKTGYRFYTPFNIAGDSDFYIHFQQYDWYYMPWKWEHEIVLAFIKPENKILEVGCGEGAFLKKIHELTDVECVGLELNESSVLNSQKIKIENSTIEEYSENNKQQFELVCSFQVLEHISHVNSFIKAQVDCLKRGGLLIISVPNNNSFTKYDKKHALNMPPHHIGLWDEESLKSLEKYFELKFKKIFYEPLQPYHFSWYTILILQKYMGSFASKILHRSIMYMGLQSLIDKYLTKKASQIKGHSIMIIFEKI